MRFSPLALAALVMAAPFVVRAQAPVDHAGQHLPTADASVDFGVLPPPGTPTPPLGPLPCLQVGAIGGPADPCAYKLHHLVPEDVTINKWGQVSFPIHGGGHALHISEVNIKTTRDDIGQWLCAGQDPQTITKPAEHPCNLSAANADGSHVVSDAKDDVVIAVAPNVTNAHPDNRVWFEPGRLMSAGGMQFLNGGTVPAGPTSNGQLISYRFLKTGRYLVACMNRVHFLNDWMFGFVNATGS